MSSKIRKEQPHWAGDAIEEKVSGWKEENSQGNTSPIQNFLFWQRDGFYGYDKIPFDNGERYQTGITLTRIGQSQRALKTNS